MDVTEGEVFGDQKTGQIKITTKAGINYSRVETPKVIGILAVVGERASKSLLEALPTYPGRGWIGMKFNPMFWIKAHVLDVITCTIAISQGSVLNDEKERRENFDVEVNIKNNLTVAAGSRCSDEKGRFFVHHF